MNLTGFTNLFVFWFGNVNVHKGKYKYKVKFQILNSKVW